LNKVGRLAIVGEAVVISSAEASSVLDVEVGKLKVERFPGTRTALRLAELRNSANGASNGRSAKISYSEYPRILERLAAGERQAVIAADYGVTQGRIAQIASHERRCRAAATAESASEEPAPGQ
jgi:hypothetical protein